eukprot:g8655.t1
MSVCYANGYLTRVLPIAGSRRFLRRSTTRVSTAKLDALVLDCDGVIVESENLHRVAYNDSFKEFNVLINGDLVDWSEEFYDEFQNKVGGGKPKMRWYFRHHGWPTTSRFLTPPEDPESQEALIDELQSWKSSRYRELIGSGEIEPRPGILRLIKEAREKGLKVAVCSASTKPSVVFVLENLLGDEIFSSLDCFLAGDDVKEKKPNPLIYKTAAERLGLAPRNCLVIEDSAIGVEAALGAGMRCIVTYTRSSKSQSFQGAELIVPNLENPTPIHIEQFLNSSIVS